MQSSQGLRIDNDITIFDCNISPYVDKIFIYTAITRVRDLKQVTIFKHSQYEIERKIISRYILYFKVKCDGYLEQDNKFKRPFLIDNYIRLNMTEYEKMINVNIVMSHWNMNWLTILFIQI